MKFKFNKDIYDEPLKACDSGSKKAYQYTRIIDDNGDEVLDQQEFDLDAVIQSHADECSIERIIASHVLGDDTVLNVKQGVFIDKDQYESIKNAQSNTLELNAQLLSLYQGYKDKMSFSEFSQAVKSGNFEALDSKKEVKEEVSA